jgi:hypothetical protein
MKTLIPTEKLDQYASQFISILKTRVSLLHPQGCKAESILLADVCNEPGFVDIDTYSCDQLLTLDGDFANYAIAMQNLFQAKVNAARFAKSGIDMRELAEGPIQLQCVVFDRQWVVKNALSDKEYMYFNYSKARAKFLKLVGIVSGR